MPMCKHCGSSIDMNTVVSLQTSCHGSTPAMPCSKCGLLHFHGEDPGATRSEPPKFPFLINGLVVNRPRQTSESTPDATAEPTGA